MQLLLSATPPAVLVFELPAQLGNLTAVLSSSTTPFGAIQDVAVDVSLARKHTSQ